jgi:hypothetical protein
LTLVVKLIEQASLKGAVTVSSATEYKQQWLQCCAYDNIVKTCH